MRNRRIAVLLALGAVAALAGCSGDNGGDGGTNPAQEIIDELNELEVGLPEGFGSDPEKSLGGEAIVIVDGREYRFTSDESFRCKHSSGMLDINLPLVAIDGVTDTQEDGFFTIELLTPDAKEKLQREPIVWIELREADGEVRSYVAGDKETVRVDAQQLPVTLEMGHWAASGTQELQHMGHAVPNITAEITAECLMEE